MQIWKQHIKKIILSININVVAFSKQTDKKIVATFLLKNLKNIPCTQKVCLPLQGCF